MNNYHTPVLLKKALELLNPTNSEGFWVDATCGGGGYSKAILEKIAPYGKLICIDQDPDAIKECEKNLKDFEGYTIFINENFRDIKKILFSMNITLIKGIVFDLGISSYQIDNPQKGFSYLNSGPLDMRMNPKIKLTAEEIINTFEYNCLIKIFSKYGEERFSKTIANAIVKNRPIKTTGKLADIIKRVVPKKEQIKSLSRVFQAIRIYVNSELDNLKIALTNSIDLLEQGGRIVVISYHSLEDKIVKNVFKQAASDCVCEKNTPICICNHKKTVKIITKKPITPTNDEIKLNPRARSAKLRAAEKI